VFNLSGSFHIIARRMNGSDYSESDERELNRCINRVFEILNYRLPENHFGKIELIIPRQNGKIAGEIEVAFRNRHKRRAGL
jgi:hypothetical protein